MVNSSEVKLRTKILSFYPNTIHIVRGSVDVNCEKLMQEK